MPPCGNGVAQNNVEAALDGADDAQNLRLEACGRLAAGIAHEINTPVQYIGGNVRFLDESFRTLLAVIDDLAHVAEIARERPLTPDETAQAQQGMWRADLGYLRREVPAALNQTMEGVERVTTIVRAMKLFSYPGSEQKTLADINALIESTVTLSRNEWKQVAEVHQNLAEYLPLIACFPDSLSQVFLSVLLNAAQAIAAGRRDARERGVIGIQTRLDGEAMEIRISDNGPGIPASIQPHIFAQPVTTKPRGLGTGQGLFLSHNIVVKQHHGSLRFETGEGSGATFIIRLPLTDGAERERI